MLTDAVATPLHALKRVARVQPGETVAVLGVGGIGSSAVQLARELGARVIAVARSERKQELARALGADEVVAAGDGVVDARAGADRGRRRARRRAPVRRLGGAGRGGGRDGRRRAAASSSSARRRSPCSCARSTSSGGSSSCSARGGSCPTDIADAIDLYLAGRVRTDHLLDRVRPLEEANEALDDLREGRVLRSVLVP